MGALSLALPIAGMAQGVFPREVGEMSGVSRAQLIIADGVARMGFPDILYRRKGRTIMGRVEVACGLVGLAAWLPLFSW